MRRTEVLQGIRLMKFEAVSGSDAVAGAEPGGSGLGSGCIGADLPALAGSVRGGRRGGSW